MITIPKPALLRVLFVAEAVTLAHVARAHVLSETLDRERFAPILAVSDRFARLFPTPTVPRVAVNTIPTSQFLDALAKGRPLYQSATLGAYVEEELRLIDAHRPDVVVGDFRLSLAISASLRQIPYVNVTNAYWSPYASPHYVIPSLPIARLVGPALGSFGFKLIRPAAFWWHAQAFNQAAKHFGVAARFSNIRALYTAGDQVVYADAEEIVNLENAPAHHRFLGPVGWSPSVPQPSWWDAVPSDRPIVYVSLGSSGDSTVLPSVLAGALETGCTVIATTIDADVASLGAARDRLFCAPYLPGTLTAQRAALVICNGGSPTAYQALAVGVPVLSIPSNLDQYLNASYVAKAGAGLTIRSDIVDRGRVAQAVQTLTQTPAYSARAKELERHFRRYDAASEFMRALDASVDR